MNKQKLLKKVYDEKYLYPEMKQEYIEDPSVEYKKGYNAASEQISRLIERLDEPQKVKVPEEFDEWFLQIKQKCGKAAEQFALWKICQFGFGHYFEDVSHERTPLDLSVWVSNHKDEAVHAILKGYEVEEEPKYIVPVPNLSKEFFYTADGERISFCQRKNIDDVKSKVKFTMEDVERLFPELVDTVEKVEVR